MLLIDNDTYSLEALALRLGVSLKSWNILTACNGKQGVEILDTLPVHFIITDVLSLDVDGYKVIKHRNMNYPQVVLYAMIGDYNPELINKLMAMQVSECVVKPLDFEKLSSRILLNIGQSRNNATRSFNGNKAIPWLHS